MDLTNFTNSEKKREKIKKELILNNSEIRIIKLGNKIEFFVKKKEVLEKYQNFLFMSPTHSIITDSTKKAEEFFEKSLNVGVEGLMFKNLESEYKPGLRSGAMAKLKETKEDIDVVILGAEHGMGKRAGFYSSFIIGVKNENSNDENDAFLTIGKVSSGVKEIGNQGASIENLTRLLKPLKISEDKSITKFEPKIILQVKYQEIQKSTTYDSGFALRFPRIVMLREDKTIEEINSIEDVERFV